jgi:hypothetical protein
MQMLCMPLQSHTQSNRIDINTVLALLTEADKPEDTAGNCLPHLLHPLSLASSPRLRSLREEQAGEEGERHHRHDELVHPADLHSGQQVQYERCLTALLASAAKPKFQTFAFKTPSTRTT